MLIECLIVGYGSIGQCHLCIIRSLLPQADIRALRHQNCELIQEHANGRPNMFNEALVFAPQAAAIACPSTFHIETAQPLAEAGVRVTTECRT